MSCAAHLKRSLCVRAHLSAEIYPRQRMIYQCAFPALMAGFLTSPYSLLLATTALMDAGPEFSVGVAMALWARW